MTALMNLADDKKISRGNRLLAEILQENKLKNFSFKQFTTIFIYLQLLPWATGEEFTYR